MGLSIHWELLIDTDPAGAVRLVQALQSSAQSVGFTDVGEVVEAWADRRNVVDTRPATASPAVPDLSTTSESDPGIPPTSDDLVEQVAVDRAWAMSQGLVSVPVEGSPTDTRRVAATHVVAFKAYNHGAEEAAFGLAAYEGFAGYRWAAGCATQGAVQRGGAPAFVRAHRAVIGVLDKARALGIKVTVRDDGDFWVKRDPKSLIDKLDEWEVLIAALKTGRRRSTGEPPPKLATDMRPKIEAARKARPRLDREPIDELEG